MNTILRIHFLLAAALCLALGSLRAEDQLFEGDSLGPLKLAQKSDAVTSVLGKPATKGADIEWEAIGEYVQEWHFPAQGITLAMSSAKKGGKKAIYSITAESPCKLATSRGITIGSTEADVAGAYRKEYNKEESTPGELFVAGSIYGGAMFHFKKGKVVQIFLGAAAE